MTGLSPVLLRDGDRIMRVLKEALALAGFHSIRSVEHHFVERGAGFTGMVLLAESHAAVHTYPERKYLALDIFACGNIDPSSVGGASVVSIAALRSGADGAVDELNPSARSGWPGVAVDVGGL